jgi:hypothetical protein
MKKRLAEEPELKSIFTISHNPATGYTLNVGMSEELNRRSTRMRTF